MKIKLKNVIYVKKTKKNIKKTARTEKLPKISIMIRIKIIQLKVNFQYQVGKPSVLHQKNHI